MFQLKDNTKHVLIECYSFLPESPRYLISKGRDQEAFDILVKYHAEGDRESLLVKAEMAQIKSTINLEMQIAKQSWVCQAWIEQSHELILHIVGHVQNCRYASSCVHCHGSGFVYTVVRQYSHRVSLKSPTHASRDTS